MKKKGAILLISLLILSILLVSLIIPGVLADVGDECEIDDDCDSGEICDNDECIEEETEEQEELSQIDQAYQCLENKVEDKCSTLSVEEQAFSLLALAYKSGIQSECKSELLDKSKNEECWPSGSCRLRDTAIAVLALDNINADTDEAEDWLIDQTKTPDLDWFLEIDSDGETSCTISYSGNDYTIKIKENKKINKGAGTCLSLAQSAYWLKIKDTCFTRNFTISCNKDFITTLLYKKPGSDIWHVSDQTNSASADGQTEEQVNALCFKQDNQCNYEGSLWATFSLSETGYNINAYLPYLIAYSEDNEKFSADAFLYMFTRFNDYLSNIINLQKTQGYWDLGSSYNKFYDTALNLLALDSAEESFLDARTWLLETQNNDGCWGSTRDTAFILYAVSPKEPAHVSEQEEYCTDYSHYCITSGACSEAEGNVLDNFYCSGVGRICCDKPAIEETCAEKNGQICSSDRECSSSTVSAVDGECCLASCIPISQETECKQYGYTCKSLCSDNEETKNYNCDFGDICCAEKPAGKSYWWIWLLVILIILIIVGIIFRDKVRIAIFKAKNKFKKGPAQLKRPSFPPTAPPGMMSRPVFRRSSARRARPKPKSASALDKELEDTLKKLREIGK